MKWLLTVRNNQQEIFELWNSSEKLITLIYHPSGGSLRIVANDEKRVFLIERKGFLRPKTILRNEYGIRMAQFNTEGAQENQAHVDIDGGQYSITLTSTFPGKIAIFKNTEIVTVCDLPEGVENNMDLLMLTLCWYISTSVKKAVEAYA